MFTGIIERTGTIVGLKEQGGVQRLTVAAPGIAGLLREGDSLAVSGVCLTALDVNPKLFYADLAAETLAKSSLGGLMAGAEVNLELPTAAGAPLGGHIVQGHVDGTGRLVAMEPVANPANPGFDLSTTDWWLTVWVPKELRQYMVPKGSVAIEGISLTIAETDIPRGGETIRIAVLPLTYARTNLHALKAGSWVNLEADMLVKLAVARMEEEAAGVVTGDASVETGFALGKFELTEHWLVANGY